MKKEKTKRNGWQKLLYAVVIIIGIIVVLFTVLSDFVSYDNPNASVKEIEYLKEDFNVSDILNSNNLIRPSDFNSAENKLNLAGVHFIKSGKFEDGFNLETSYHASETFSLNDFEIGALFDKYINSSASVDNLVSLKELTLTKCTENSALENYNAKIILLFNLKSIFGDLSSKDLNFLEEIYITINTKCFVALDNMIAFTNERTVKINNLNEEKSNDVLKFINGSYSADSNNNIENLPINFLKDFINKITSKTNTKLSIETTNSNSLFNYSVEIV